MSTFPPSLTCTPIGVIRTQMLVKFDTPHQPASGLTQQNVIELFPGNNYEPGLKDLEGFERIWLIWWFDRNAHWRPMVRTPRGSTHRRGVFATRSPHRPNPIGITSVPLLKITGRRLIVGNVDLLDGTHILDIKPYISDVDAFTAQRQGWLDELSTPPLPDQEHTVYLSTLAETQLSWLRDAWEIDFQPKILSILKTHPSPSRRLRITGQKDGLFRLSSGSWRVFFSVTAASKQVTVHRIAPGFPLELLEKEGREIIPHYQAQLDFETRWPTPG